MKNCSFQKFVGLRYLDNFSKKKNLKWVKLFTRIWDQKYIMLGLNLNFDILLINKKVCANKGPLHTNHKNRFCES